MENQVNANSVNSKSKKVVKIVVNVIIWLFVAFAVLMTVVALAAQTHEGVPQIGGKCYLNVLSDSMEPTIKTGDMIVAKILSDEDKLTLTAGQKDSDAPGDVISFWADLDKDGQKEINTHRIVEIKTDSNGNVTGFVTRGDNKPVNDVEAVALGDVIAVWSGKRVGGIGAFVSFLQCKVGFLVCIVLPLVALFLYQAFVFIKTLMEVKNTGKRQITAADEELIKQRAIEEYLRSQQAAANSADDTANAAPQAEDLSDAQTEDSSDN